MLVHVYLCTTPTYCNNFLFVMAYYVLWVVHDVYTSKNKIILYTSTTIRNESSQVWYGSHYQVYKAVYILHLFINFTQREFFFFKLFYLCNVMYINQFSDAIYKVKYFTQVIIKTHGPLDLNGTCFMAQCDFVKHRWPLVISIRPPSLCTQTDHY